MTVYLFYFITTEHRIDTDTHTNLKNKNSDKKLIHGNGNIGIGQANYKLNCETK